MLGISDSNVHCSLRSIWNFLFDCYPLAHLSDLNVLGFEEFERPKVIFCKTGFLKFAKSSILQG